jgi:hypothetical protein
MRRILVVGICFVSLLGLGAVAVGFFFYDRATKPDLGDPTVVARKYLTLFLVNRDDVRAGLFQCANAPGLAELRAFRSDLDSREKAYNLTIAITLDSVAETSRAGNQAQIAADIVVSTVDAGRPLRRVLRWELTARNEDGWRICGGHQAT